LSSTTPVSAMRMKFRYGPLEIAFFFTIAQKPL
jgi:hypothetical protein